MSPVRYLVDFAAWMIGVLFGWLIFDDLLFTIMLGLIFGGGAETAQRASRK